MKKVSLFIGLFVLMLAGCNSASLNLEMSKEPVYEEGTSSEMVVRFTKDGEPVEGLSVTASLEMAKMDHGEIEVDLVDQGDGNYSGDVTLPMGGEWIAEVKADSEDEKAEELITFDVEER